ncbi:hypothetical protein, partial [Escherichia coli]
RVRQPFNVNSLALAAACAALDDHDYLAQSRRQAWGSLNPDLRRALSLYDLDAGKWDLLREMDTRMADGRDYMTPDGVADIT